ncbi:MAG: Re/Si-specific NAD(P)(+) transhydrogenase subunit alpha [Halobacteriota archaeon]
MIVGVPSETVPGETRVALVPEAAKSLVEDGHTVRIAAGAGDRTDWSDDEYREVGCEIVEDRADVFDGADVILQVNGLGAAETVDPYDEDQLVIDLLGPYDVDDATLEDVAEKNVSAFALELIPRISRAQSMDALSSMSSIGGYKAAITAAEALPKMFPLQMTAAGTVQPAEVFVIGAGVAGLQSIATANRLGASVRAYDIRLEVRQEVQSLGAEFVELDLETEGSGDEEGYAREMDEEFYRQQRKELTRVVADSDVVITTAAIPGRAAPELVTSEMIDGMDPGSVIVDLAAATGGNCEPTVPDETIEHAGVTVFGPTNLPASVPHHASQLYANNVTGFLEELLEEGELVVDTDDEIVDSTLLTHEGRVRNPHVRDTDESADDEDESDGEPADEDTADEDASDDSGDHEPNQTDETMEDDSQ